MNFLKKGFHYSTVMIAEVTSGTIKRPSTHQLSAASAMASAQSDNNSTSHLSSTTTEWQIDPIPKKRKEAIMSFIQRLAEDCGESMPHRPEIHLPFHEVQEVFPIFNREFVKLYPKCKPVTESYFRRVWVETCPHVKVRKSTRFTICEVCDSLRVQLRKKVEEGHSTEDVKKRRAAHLEFVGNERMAYQRKKDRARLHGIDFCSIIIDGADQSAFGLPHFTTTPKSQRGHAMKVKLVGILEHRLVNQLSLLTMTQEHQTGSNHVIEALHRFLMRKRKEGPLPSKLFVQLDNCSRENKNKFVMAFMEFLVASHVFDRVECGFLPIGHTHEDVDQAFSATSSRLRISNAITLSDLHSVLRTTYGGNVHVEHMKRIANFSGLCDQYKCLRRVDKITQYRYFLFCSENPTDPSLKSSYRSTTCYVKKNCDDKWENLYPSHSKAIRAGILTACPDISNTPATNIKCPDGLEDVKKRLWSEDERINNPDKVIDLHELRDFVFSDRTDPFHWDLATSVETEHIRTKAANTSDSGAEAGSDVQRDSDEQNGRDDNDDCSDEIVPVPARKRRPNAKAAMNAPDNTFDYDVGSFVLVRSDDNAAVSNKCFWVAKVLGVLKNNGTNYATNIKVHWYDRDANSEPNADPFNVKYSPCYGAPKKKRQKQSDSVKPTRRDLKVPHHDEIHTDTVLVHFPALTRNRMIPLATQKKLTF